MTLFALSFTDLGLSETLLHIVRIIAAVGGAVVGWFVCDPLTRLIYRLSFRGATPGSLLLAIKSSGAGILAVLIYVYLPLGGGGGLGFGPGQGGLPGKGSGEGGDKIAQGNGNPLNRQNIKDNKDGKDSGDPKLPHKLELIEIEILGGHRLKDERFYLVKGITDPLNQDELKDYFIKNLGKIKIVPILTEDTVGLERENNPLARLNRLADDHKIERLPHKMIDP